MRVHLDTVSQAVGHGVIEDILNYEEITPPEIIAIMLSNAGKELNVIGSQVTVSDDVVTTIASITLSIMKLSMMKVAEGKMMEFKRDELVGRFVLSALSNIQNGEIKESEIITEILELVKGSVL